MVINVVSYLKTTKEVKDLLRRYSSLRQRQSEGYIKLHTSIETQIKLAKVRDDFVDSKLKELEYKLEAWNTALTNSVYEIEKQLPKKKRKKHISQKEEMVKNVQINKDNCKTN